MTTQERPVAGFSAVELRGIGTLRIEMGDTERLTIEADDDTLRNIITEVVGHKLVIKFDTWSALTNWIQSRPVSMHLTVRELNSVALTGAGSVEASIAADRLELSIAGAGSMRVGVRTTELAVSVSGTGDVTLAGTADTQEVRITGSGNYDALQMPTRVTKIFIGGAGRAKISVSDELDVQIGGAGTVTYKGSPRVDQRIGGFGRVERAPEAPPSPTPGAAAPPAEAPAEPEAAAPPENPA